MATIVRRYKRLGGVSKADLDSVVPGGVADVGEGRPGHWIDVTVENDGRVVDLDAVMLTDYKYEFEQADPPALAAVAIKQIKSYKLAGDGASISVGGWETILTGTIQTIGGSTLGIVSCAGGRFINSGAEYRLVLNGGDFSGKIYGPVRIGSVDKESASFTTFEALDLGASVMYTVELQMQAVGILGSVTPMADVTSLVLFEYS